MKKICQKCKDVCQKCKSIFKELLRVSKENLLLTIIVVAVAVAIIGLGAYSVCAKSGFSFGIMTAKTAAQKAVDYINNDLLKIDSKDGVFLKSAKKDGAIYRATISYQGQDSNIYVTKDGKYLFPEMKGVPINLDETPADASNNLNGISACEAVPKADSPVFQAFVMSDCPFGLQMQRILAKLVKDAPAAKDNVKIRYIGAVVDGKITSMHGDEEAQENLRQICIREEQPAKYWGYVSCYMKKAVGTLANGMPKGDSAGCLASTGVNSANLNACMEDASKGLKYAEDDFALANQLGFSGSPSLAINGAAIEEFDQDTNQCLWTTGCRTADAEKSIICCGSNVPGSFCASALSKEPAATSFSEVYAGSSGTANDPTCE